MDWSVRRSHRCRLYDHLLSTAAVLFWTSVSSSAVLFSRTSVSSSQAGKLKWNGDPLEMQSAWTWNDFCLAWRAIVMVMVIHLMQDKSKHQTMQQWKKYKSTRQHQMSAMKWKENGNPKSSRTRLVLPRKEQRPNPPKKEYYFNSEIIPNPTSKTQTSHVDFERGKRELWKAS